MTGNSLLMVSAGLSGAVLARQLAKAGHDVTVLNARDHGFYSEPLENWFGRYASAWGYHTRDCATLYLDGLAQARSLSAFAVTQ